MPVPDRRRRGAVLVLGGLAVALLVGDGRPLPFAFLPLVTGLYGALLLLWGGWELLPRSGRSR